MIKYINTILLTSMIAVFFPSCHDNRVYYIENSIVFNEFAGTKELIKRNAAILNPYTNKMDSLDLLIKNTENIIQSDMISQSEKNKVLPEYQRFTKEYDTLLERFLQLKEELEDNATAKIWTQINAGIAEYGKKNNLPIILGAMGNGNIMYAREGSNITQQIIKHLNEYYEGE